MKPLISIIIVNYNGARWLHTCIESLLAQDYPNFEIIFVDNASSDESLKAISNFQFQISNFKLIRNKENLGFSGGSNVGVKHAKGEYILLLNNDTKVDKDFLKKFVRVFEKIPSASIAQSKIVLMKTPTILDSCGSFWTNTSLLYHYGNLKDETLPQYNKPFRVFSVKGASVLIKKEVIDKLGLFDEDTWCYYEETDFCHRAWVAGYESWYWPEAKVYHAQGGTSLTFSNDYIQFHNFKNKLLSFIKNFETVNLLYIIPEFLMINVLLSVYWVVQGKSKHSLSLYKAIAWNIIQLPKTLAKRTKVQKHRKNADRTYFKYVKKSPKFIYYLHLMNMQFNKYADLPL